MIRTHFRFIKNHLWKEQERNEEPIGSLLCEFFRLYSDAIISGKGLRLDLVNGLASYDPMGRIAAVCPITERLVNVFQNEPWMQICNELQRANKLLTEVRSRDIQEGGRFRHTEQHWLSCCLNLHFRGCHSRVSMKQSSEHWVKSIWVSVDRDWGQVLLTKSNDRMIVS